MLREGAPVQIALVTISDRSPLFESSDIRMRGPGQQQVTPSDQRFRDVEVPTNILRTVVNAAGGSARAVAVRELEPYLTNATPPLSIVVDSALKQRIETDSGRAVTPVPRSRSGRDRL